MADADLESTIKNMESGLTAGIQKTISAMSNSSDAGMKQLSSTITTYLGSLKEAGDALRNNNPAEALTLMTNVMRTQKIVTDEVTAAFGANSKEAKELAEGINKTADGAKSLSKTLDGTKKTLDDSISKLKSFSQVGSALNSVFGESFVSASALKGALAAADFATGKYTEGILKSIESTNMFIVGMSKINDGWRDTALSVNAASTRAAGDIKNDFDVTKGIVARTVKDMNWQFAIGAEKTQSIMTDLAANGFKNLGNDIGVATKEVFLMSKSLNMSTSQITGLAGVLTKEFKYSWNQSRDLILGLAETATKANVTQADYVQTLINSADKLKEYNVSLTDLNKMFAEGTSKSIGWSRTIAYANEMTTGLSRQDIGRRAFAAQEMGQGKGSIFGAATLLGYNSSSEQTEKYLNSMLRSTGGSSAEIKRLSGGSTEDKEKAAGMVAMAAKAGGMDERVLLEKFGLIEQKKDPVTDNLVTMNKTLGQMGETYKSAISASDTMQKMGKMADYAVSGTGIYTREADNKVYEAYKKVQVAQDKQSAAIAELRKAEERGAWGGIIGGLGKESTEAHKKELEQARKKVEKADAELKIATDKYEPIANKHSGGEIRSYFHAGGEVPAVLESGEFVMNKNASQGIGYQNLERMNSGGGGGASNISVNVDLNVNRLKGLKKHSVAE
jgi:hypothetical protein